MPSRKTKKRKEKVSGGKYPWDKWFKKLGQKTNNVLVLTKGDDYECMTHSFYIQLWNEAKYRGVRLTTRTLKNNKGIEVRRRVDA